MISVPVVHSAQTVHPSSAEINTISKQNRNELPLHPRHLEVPSGVPKMISGGATFGTNCAPILRRD
jgi:hypothetical protein